MPPYSEIPFYSSVSNTNIEPKTSPVTDDEIEFTSPMIDTQVPPENLNNKRSAAVSAGRAFYYTQEHARNFYKPDENINTQEDCQLIYSTDEPESDETSIASSLTSESSLNTNGPLHLAGVSMQVIGLFSATLGVGAIAMGLALNVLSIGTLGNMAIIAGAATSLLGLGLFALGKATTKCNQSIYNSFDDVASDYELTFDGV